MKGIMPKLYNVERLRQKLIFSNHMTTSTVMWWVQKGRKHNEVQLILATATWENTWYITLYNRSGFKELWQVVPKLIL